jgi:hypothetical protein
VIEVLDAKGNGIASHVFPELAEIPQEATVETVRAPTSNRRARDIQLWE